MAVDGGRQPFVFAVRIGRERAACVSAGFGLIKFRIERIEIFAVQAILRDSKSFTEALEVYDFPLSQKADGIADLRIVDQAEDIVVGGAGLLLCCSQERTAKTAQEAPPAIYA